MADDPKIIIIRIIAEQALIDVADVKLEHSLADLAIDSLALVESIFAIAEAFDIDIPYNANEPDMNEFDISSVATIINAVEKLVVEQSA